MLILSLSTCWPPYEPELLSDVALKPFGYSYKEPGPFVSRVPVPKQWDSKSLKHILDCFALKQMEDTQIENLRLFLKHKEGHIFSFQLIDTMAIS